MSLLLNNKYPRNPQKLIKNEVVGEQFGAQFESGGFELLTQKLMVQ